MKSSGTTEEWEIRAKRDQGMSWLVSDSLLPVVSRESAQRICDSWHELYPHISYKPEGYIVTKKRIKETA